MIWTVGNNWIASIRRKFKIRGSINCTIVTTSTYTIPLGITKNNIQHKPQKWIRIQWWSTCMLQQCTSECKLMHIGHHPWTLLGSMNHFCIWICDMMDSTMLLQQRPLEMQLYFTWLWHNICRWYGDEGVTCGSRWSHARCQGCSATPWRRYSNLRRVSKQHQTFNKTLQETW